jgi:hypothetical protein
MYRRWPANYIPVAMKRNFVVAIAIGVLILVSVQYFLLPQWYRVPGIRVSGWVIMVSIAAGLVFGGVLVRIAIRGLLAGRPMDLFGLGARAPRGVKIGAYAATIVAYPFAIFVGFVVGGNLGGALGATVIPPEAVGVIVGISTGIFVVTTSLAIAAAVIGFIFGGLIAMLVSKEHRQ